MTAPMLLYLYQKMANLPLYLFMRNTPELKNVDGKNPEHVLKGACEKSETWLKCFSTTVFPPFKNQMYFFLQKLYHKTT